MNPCLCPLAEPHFPICKMDFFSHYLSGPRSVLLGRILSGPIIQMGQQDGCRSTTGDLDKAVAPQAVLPAPAALQGVNGGFRPPDSSSTLWGPGAALICPQCLWGHKGGAAARNPSMCHVRSKLWFSLRAWAKPSFWG